MKYLKQALSYGQQFFGPPAYGQQQGPPQGYGHPPMLDLPQKYYAPPPPPPKRLFVLLGMVALLGLLAICAMAVPTPGARGSNPLPGPAAATATVVYEVEGAGTLGNITYTTDGTGLLAQEVNARLPWRKEVQVPRGFTASTVKAQNKSSGEIRCRISVDGKVIKEIASSGLFTVVSCAGTP